MNFRKAMAAPADMPEFKGNVVAVDTAPFWDHVIEAAQPKQGEYNNIVGTAHTLKTDGTLDREWKWDNYWKPIGKPLPEERIWRFVTIDATEKKDKLEKYDDRRFRDITLPAGMENWYMPDFDDSKWTEGKAPIGKGVWKHSGITLDKFPSTWGKGEFLLMRTTFEVEDLNYDSYRIAILARQGFHVYLNGQKIHTYIWWQDKPQYGSIVLEKEQIKHLKKGKNVLAVYANDQYDPNPQNIMPRSMCGLRESPKQTRRSSTSPWRKSFRPKTGRPSKALPMAVTTISAVRRSLRRWARHLQRPCCLYRNKQ